MMVNQRLNWWCSSTTKISNRNFLLKSDAATQVNLLHMPLLLAGITKFCIILIIILFSLEGLPVDKVKIKQAFLSLPMAEAFQNLFLDQNIEQG